MARSLLAAVICLAAGFTVMGIAASALPPPPPPPEGVRDALAGRPFDLVEVARHNRQVRLPGQLLVWLIIPVAAAVMGIVGTAIDRQRGVVVAPVSFVVLWLGLMGTGLDTYDLSFGAFYTVVSGAAAWATHAVVRKRRSAGSRAPSKQD